MICIFKINILIFSTMNTIEKVLAIKNGQKVAASHAIIRHSLDLALGLTGHKITMSHDPDLELNTPGLVAATHQLGPHDVLSLGYAWLHYSDGEPLHFLYKEEYDENPILKAGFRVIGGQPLNRQKRKQSQFEGAIETLRSGESVALFPQGEHRRGGIIGETGRAKLLKTMAKLGHVPVYLAGIFSPRQDSLFAIRDIHVHFGSFDPEKPLRQSLDDIYGQAVDQWRHIHPPTPR